MIHPLSDSILVERLPVERSSGIIVPNELSTLVKIIAVGPGKWHRGEWWFLKGKWEWLEGYREEPVVAVGQKGIIGPYTDLEVGAQILCQQNDIRCLVD